MKAILIDAAKEKVLGIELESGKDVDKAFAGFHKFVDVSLGVFVIDGSNLLMYDEMGVLNNPATYFHFNGFRRPLYGRGLILGINDNGHTSTTLTAKQVVSSVKFHGLGAE